MDRVDAHDIVTLWLSWVQGMGITTPTPEDITDFLDEMEGRGEVIG